MHARKEIATWILLLAGGPTGLRAEMEHMDGAADGDQHDTHNSQVLDPMFFGCGRTDLNESYRYGLLNEKMHVGMAINFTGNAEYDFNAAMIPHHAGAVEMCDIYNHAVSATGATSNPGIESLCYNITYGPVSWGVYQHDFSQPGENEQMLDIINDIGMMRHYEAGCSALTEDARKEIADHSEHGMFMGCGKLDSEMTNDYISANMDMHMYMALNFTGDPAVDFLLGMMPHHEGAIEMCDIYYKYWSCAPERKVCQDPLPLAGIQENLSARETKSILNAVYHICSGHIMESQPAEVKWMKKELGRISPEALTEYEAMQIASTYPCSTGMQGSHDMDSGTMADIPHGGGTDMDLDLDMDMDGDMGDMPEGEPSSAGQRPSSSTSASRNTSYALLSMNSALLLSALFLTCWN